MRVKSSLNIVRKANLLNVNRSTLYYKPTREEDVDLMNEIRDLYEERCYMGYRRITEMLKRKRSQLRTTAGEPISPTLESAKAMLT